MNAGKNWEFQPIQQDVNLRKIEQTWYVYAIFLSEKQKNTPLGLGCA
jgi:hypothetical protein